MRLTLYENTNLENSQNFRAQNSEQNHHLKYWLQLTALSTGTGSYATHNFSHLKLRHRKTSFANQNSSMQLFSGLLQPQLPATPQPVNLPQQVWHNQARSCKSTDTEEQCLKSTCNHFVSASCSYHLCWTLTSRNIQDTAGTRIFCLKVLWLHTCR